MREIKFPDIGGVIGFKNPEMRGNKFHITFKVGIFDASQLQNEFDINFKISLVGGRIGIPSSKYYPMNGSLIQSKVIHQPLYYGMPYTSEYQIEVDSESNELVVLLSFGEANHPQKTSTYKLRIKNFVLVKSRLILQKRLKMYRL